MANHELLAIKALLKNRFHSFSQLRKQSTQKLLSSFAFNIGLFAYLSAVLFIFKEQVSGYIKLAK